MDTRKDEFCLRMHQNHLFGLNESVFSDGSDMTFGPSLPHNLKSSRLTWNVEPEPRLGFSVDDMHWLCLS